MNDMPLRKRSEKRGLEPGTLVHIGTRAAEATSISVTAYGDALFTVAAGVAAEALSFPAEPGVVQWIDVTGLQDVTVIARIGKEFGLHPLLMEDVVNTRQRPKVESYGDYLFLVLKAVALGNGSRPVETEQVSLVVGPGYVISFREAAGPLFDQVREWLRQGGNLLRRSGGDFLAYSLIDAIVDGYFLFMEDLEERIEELEEKILKGATSTAPAEIHSLKRAILAMRGFLWPTREMLGNLERVVPGPIVQETTLTFLRDVHDHVIQMIDSMGILRDTVSGLLDIYLTSVSYRLNEIMKVLTIIATIFMPLTFLAGVYGMNFRHMPEIEWTFGYPLVLLLMAVATGAMLLYFKRRGWLGRGP